MIGFMSLSHLALRRRASSLVATLAAVLATGVVAAAQRTVTTGAQNVPLTAPVPVDPRITVGTLPNGLRYYLRDNKQPLGRAELRLVVNAGSILEDEDQRGLAHFVEHMAFNGTAHFPKQDVVAFLQSTGMRFGAHINANTSFDQTVFQLQIPTDSASVVDRAGVLRAMARADGAGPHTVQSSEKKAYTASSLRRPTTELAELINKVPTLQALRDVNERINAVNEARSVWVKISEWVCECADEACTERIEMTPEEYEGLRATPLTSRSLPPRCMSFPM